LIGAVGVGKFFGFAFYNRCGTVGVALGMEESIPYGIKEPAKTEFLPFLQDLDIEKISFPSNGVFTDILPDHFKIFL
jgi:hypothetical protein